VRSIRDSEKARDDRSGCRRLVHCGRLAHSRFASVFRSALESAHENHDTTIAIPAGSTNLQFGRSRRETPLAINLAYT
jgi:hypothetical protein